MLRLTKCVPSPNPFLPPLLTSTPTVLIHYISSFYARGEQAKRISIFYCCNVICRTLYASYRPRKLY